MRRLLVLCVALGIAGCYATCTPPEVRAADHGLVLDCNVDRSDSRREVCKVSTGDGDKFCRYVRCQ
jgi:hypothetical protein